LGDVAVGEDVGAEPATMNEGPKKAGPVKPFEVGAGFGEALTTAEDVADVEVASDEGVEVNAAGEDVAAGAGEVVRGISLGEYFDDFGGDQGEVVAGSVGAAGAERAGVGGVAVALEPSPVTASAINGGRRPAPRALAERGLGWLHALLPRRGVRRRAARRPRSADSAGGPGVGLG